MVRDVHDALPVDAGHLNVAAVHDGRGVVPRDGVLHGSSLHLKQSVPRISGLHSSTSQLNLSRVCHNVNTPYILNTLLHPLNKGFTTPYVHPLSHTKRSS